jgi:hypothetical protein
MSDKRYVVYGAGHTKLGYVVAANRKQAQSAAVTQYGQGSYFVCAAAR